MIRDFGRFFPVRSRSHGSLRTGRQSVGGTTRADRGVLPIDRGDEGAAPPPPLKPRAGAPLISALVRAVAEPQSRFDTRTLTSSRRAPSAPGQVATTDGRVFELAADGVGRRRAEVCARLVGSR